MLSISPRIPNKIWLESRAIMLATNDRRTKIYPVVNKPRSARPTAKYPAIEVSSSGGGALVCRCPSGLISDP
jgi:hypothetical protein